MLIKVLDSVGNNETRFFSWSSCSYPCPLSLLLASRFFLSSVSITTYYSPLSDPSTFPGRNRKSNFQDPRPLAVPWLRLQILYTGFCLKLDTYCPRWRHRKLLSISGFHTVEGPRVSVHGAWLLEVPVCQWGVIRDTTCGVTRRAAVTSNSPNDFKVRKSGYVVRERSTGARKMCKTVLLVWGVRGVGRKGIN